jgi:hypothetical protein
MRKFFILSLLLSSTSLFAQDELKLAEAFLKSVQDKNFTLLKPWLGPNAKTMQVKWQQVVDKSHRDGFDIKSIKIKNLVPGEKVPGLHMKTIIAVY